MGFFVRGLMTDATSALATKPSCGVAATSNLTLSGEQTIDSQLTNGTLVLCSAQSSGSENGPWISGAGTWTRPAWYATGNTVQSFQFITTHVRLGTIYAGSVWRCTTSGTIIIGTTATVWTVVAERLNSSTVGGNAINVGNLDGVLGANTPAAGTVTNLTLSGSGRIIAADFSNGTLTSRAYLQTSTVNGVSNIGALPNGTGTASDFIAFNNATPTNAGYAWLAATSTGMTVNSAAAGSGTVLPLSLQTNSLDRFIVRPSSSTAQTTAGQGIQFPTATWTDSSSSGTVANTAVFAIAAQTLAAGSATTYSRAATWYVAGVPIAGTNVTSAQGRSIYAADIAELSRSVSGSVATALILTNVQTAVNSGIALDFCLSTNVGTATARVASIRTNRAVGGDSDIIFSAFSNSALVERVRIRDDGRTTFTGGAIVLATAGMGLELKSGTGARAGNATLVGGTVTVSNTTVTANTLVHLTRKTSGGTIGTAITYTLSAGTSFTITSDNILDTSVFTFMLVELN